MTTLELHGIYHELAFWQQFVKTDRFLKGWVGKVKTPEPNQEVADFIKSVPHETVLDVGSGVYRDWETDRKSTRLNSSH